MQNCPKCGRPVVNKFFCPSCGQSLIETQNEGATQPPQVAEQSPQVAAQPLQLAAQPPQLAEQPPQLAEQPPHLAAQAPELKTGIMIDPAPVAEPQTIRQAPVAHVAHSKQSRIWLLLIAVAIAGIGSLMLFAASRRATTTPSVTASAEIRVDKALPNSRPRESVREPSPGPSPQWVTKGPSRRGFNGISFELAAVDDVDVWHKRVRPVLTVRCTPKETEVFVWTQSAASIEASGKHTVQVTFDDARSAAEMWEHSVDHDALFAPDGKALMRQIADAGTMSFTFTPFNAPPALVRFSVDGFDEQMKSAGRACGWR
jgi:hypothetical protein